MKRHQIIMNWFGTIIAQDTFFVVTTVPPLFLTPLTLASYLYFAGPMPINSYLKSLGVQTVVLIAQLPVTREPLVVVAARQGNTVINNNAEGSRGLNTTYDDRYQSRKPCSGVIASITLSISQRHKIYLSCGLNCVLQKQHACLACIEVVSK